jgi:ArsR family transcriptional regulator
MHSEYVHRSTPGENPVLNARNEIDVIQTSLLRALASPHRLRIIHLLGERPREVHELAGELDLPQSAVSQHLAAMRGVGLVEAGRDGRSVRYRLADPQVLAACALMREVIVRRLSALGSLAAAARRIDLEATSVAAATNKTPPTAGSAGAR